MTNLSDDRIENIQSAINSAVEFLLNARNSYGWWEDFHLAAGISDEWVTGYVGTALAKVPIAAAQQAARKAWEVLNTRRTHNSGWGYNRITPIDADSTGWALQLAHALGTADSDRARAAHHILAKYIKADLSQPDAPPFVTTYFLEGPIRQFIGYPWYMPMRGWCDTPHLCVTAAIAHLPEFRDQLLPYLRSNQNPDGSWSGYWWCDREYSTALAAMALAQSRLPEDQQQVSQAVRWAQQRVTEGINSGSAFALAWQTAILRCSDAADSAGWRAFDIALIRLLEMQRPDGAWSSSAWLRVPLPDDRAPDQYTNWLQNGSKEGSTALDQCRIFTASTALNTLQSVVGSARS